MRIAHGTLILALAGSAAFGADVYRSTAPDGTVSYSDRPQGTNAEYVFTAASRAARPTPAGQTAAPGPAGDAAPEAPATPRPLTGANAQQLRAERQKNCEVAQERQQRYDLSRRLYRTNSAGEREYLDDAAVAAARAKAAQDVKDWCG